MLFPACSTMLVKPHPPQPCSHPGLCEERCPGLTDSCSHLGQLLAWTAAAKSYFGLHINMRPPALPAWNCSLSPQDDQIERERASQHLPGGCCALAAIYLLGKFYVANAGDSRYVPEGQPLLFTQEVGGVLVGQQGQAEPPLPALSRDSVFCCDLCACPVPMWGYRTTSQNLGLAPFPPDSILSASQMALDHHTPAPGASAGLGCKLRSDSCPQQSFQKCARSHFRAHFIAGEGHTEKCPGSLGSKDSEW